MVVVLNQGASKKTMQKLLEKLLKRKKQKGVDTHKFCGVITLKTDPLTLQKNWRDEWN
ncbi:MAG TPA: hypothetical protein VK021_02285 [Flavobacteriaceae bacterium]|nr:hypothetical protein [Flavobacteriaceae bacterium]